MFPVLMAVLGTTLYTPTVIYLDAYEAREHGVSVETAGTYHVWVWARNGAPAGAATDSATYETAALTLGVHTFEFPIGPGDSKTATHRWRRLGQLELPEGRVALTLDSDAIAGIVFTTRHDLDPAIVPHSTRVRSEPIPTEDGRARIERDTDTRFAMTHFPDRAAWESFASDLRRRMLVATGLWPMPERTPLNAIVEEVARHDDYIVEKVRFEARPGFLVTGNLYRPLGDGPFPAIANPHGHWKNGRFEDTENSSVPGRCITFARMGMVAFSYDMAGYNDSRQWPHGGAPDSGEQRRQALWGIHPFAIQLWSSVRALDFLESLPYVDPDKLNCTGASGGGTQTFALTAIDPRVKVSAPVNMISHSMQGGCICENAPLIRFNASNMEIGALMAPRPMMMISATGDWTRDTPRVEYPAIRGIYALYDAADKVENVHIDAGHNYNKASREGVYRFFGKHILGGDRWAEFTEPPFKAEPIEALKVFPGDTPPAGYPSFEETVAHLIASNRDKWNAILPADSAGLDAFRAMAAPALMDALGAAPTDPAGLNVNLVGEEPAAGYVVQRITFGRPGAKDVVPALVYQPLTKALKGTVVVVHGEGKAALADIEHGGPGPLVSALLLDGRAVIAPDVFLTGEHHAPGRRTERLNKKFPDTFLPSDTAYRVQDVLTAVALARRERFARGPVDVVGLGDAGVWCLFAAAIDTGIRNVCVDANGFAADEDSAWVEGPYVPCIRAIGGVTTAAALIAPRRLTVLNAHGDRGWNDAMAIYGRLTGTNAIAEQQPSVESVVSAL
ncbi:MAG: hypothetical protein AMXMBFR4_05610 [Candidatus Hydrogenedentota bacterium]